MSAGLTVQKSEYRRTLKAADAVLGALHSLGLPFTRFDTEAMLRAATRQAGGLDDFGDAYFREPMRVLLDCLGTKPLSNLGKVLSRTTMIKALSNRLQIEAYCKAHPEVLDIPIEQPLFILGFPRTGTTLLQNLLCLDEGERALQFWEVQNPAPVSDDPEVDRRKRVRVADFTLWLAYFVAPEQRAIHEIQSTSVEECWPLFSNSFTVLNYDLQSNFREYGEWLLDFDMRPSYAFYKKSLQVLAHRTKTRHFVLKCPEHLWFLDALLAVFPDARIVWTHRDPVASVASYCSLISLAQRMLYGRFDAHALGANIVDRFRTGVQRAMDARDRVGEAESHHFYDVDFKRLVRDPARFVREIKDWAGLAHDGASEARVQRWLTTERGDKRGAHKYSADVYGLDAQAIHDLYRPYIDRFSIPLKRP